MEFSLTSINKLFKRKKRIVQTVRMHPVREWFIGLGILVAIFVAGSTYAGQFLIRNLDSGSLNDETPTGVTEYKETLVQDVLETYAARAASFELLQNAPAAGPIVVPVATSNQTQRDDTTIGVE